MRYGQFAILVLITCLTTSATAEIKRLQFLGWSPDSKHLALRSFTIDKSKKTTTEVQLYILSRKLTVLRAQLKTKDPLAYLREKHYKAAAATTQKRSTYVQVITSGTRELARFELIVGASALKFKVSVKDKRKRWKLARSGRFRELYALVQPTGYLSPDGKKLVLIVHKRTPFVVHDSMLVLITRH